MATEKADTPAPLRLAPLTAVSLRNDAVVIGPLIPDDMGALFLWLNDRDAANQDQPYQPVDWLSYKAWLERMAQEKIHTFFAIRKLTAPLIIGYVTFKNIQAVHRSGEIGMRIGNEADRGKGYGKSALSLALLYAFNHLNLHRVSLTAFAHNERAIAAYRAAGFKDEGLLKDAAFIDGRYVDMVAMAILNPRG